MSLNMGKNTADEKKMSNKKNSACSAQLISMIKLISVLFRRKLKVYEFLHIWGKPDQECPYVMI